jgi:hypothetical protein
MQLAPPVRDRPLPCPGQLGREAVIDLLLQAPTLCRDLLLLGFESSELLVRIPEDTHRASFCSNSAAFETLDRLARCSRKRSRTRDPVLAGAVSGAERDSVPDDSADGEREPEPAEEDDGDEGRPMHAFCIGSAQDDV